VLALFKIWFVQRNSITALPHTAMRMVSVTSGAGWNSVLALVKLYFVQPNSIATLLNSELHEDSPFCGILEQRLQ
jgi:hypothetical protein